ncbi:hypothetical protein BOTBODRAFT_125553 [Botryobasidium botryosum FD-172 SS1]|uniref:ADP-ribosylglycohydrolase n=1 Tax=Botryobasidium botryosum (strain FD-172 SS1) TaxID=930990 RepID=A0A067MW88_BOTB1|nr:hypothetical protein BOTBODRAFT_125553 [Botryobasidium botryosum FD-172 SS1]
MALDLIRGAMFGCAVGDAIGLHTEFMSRSVSLSTYGPDPRFALEYPAPKGFVPLWEDRHRSKFPPGGWTDDTDQSILILMSFLRSGGRSVTPKDFAKRLRFWIENGFRPLDRLPLGIGLTVKSVVTDADFPEHPTDAAKRQWEKSDRNLASNGAVMRTGIVGALFWQDKDGVGGIERTIKVAAEVAATTHADPRCIISSIIVSALVAASIRDELKSIPDMNHIIKLCEDFMSTYDTPLLSSHLEELHAHLSVSSLDELKLDELEAIGYTYKCLGAGVWALRQILTTPPITPTAKALAYEKIITDLTMQGGDGDTNCAVAGSLLGAALGMSHLPRHWLVSLSNSEWLMNKTDAACYLMGLHHMVYDYEADADTLVDGGLGAFTRAEMDGKVMMLQIEAAERMKAFSSKPPKRRIPKCIIM